MGRDSWRRRGVTLVAVLSGVGVVFELPTNVTVQRVSFSLAAGYLDVAEWTN